MPAKDPEKRRATVRAWYARTKHQLTVADFDKRRDWRTTRRRALAAWFGEIKSQLACRQCGESHPACIQFHHRDPSAKEISLSDAVRKGWGRNRILDEAAKCEVLCGNCHAKHHARENARG